MSTTFDLTLIEGMQNCGLSGHEATVRGAALRRNKVAVIFDFSGGSHCDSTDDEDDYDSLDDLNLESMVLNQNSGQLSQEEQRRRHCEKHGKNFTEVYHRKHILKKVAQLKIEDKWMGEKDWENDINAIFKEGDRITGKRAYEIALECGMPKRTYQIALEKRRRVNAKEHHRQYIQNSVIEKKKRWTGDDDWETDINANFKEGDRISGASARKIAVEYGMHSKQNQKLFDSLAESKTPACGWCLNYFGKLNKCPACNSVRYCDRKCQNAHWGEHSKECQKK